MGGRAGLSYLIIAGLGSKMEVCRSLAGQVSVDGRYWRTILWVSLEMPKAHGAVQVLLDRAPLIETMMRAVFPRALRCF